VWPDTLTNNFVCNYYSWVYKSNITFPYVQTSFYLKLMQTSYAFTTVFILLLHWYGCNFPFFFFKLNLFIMHRMWAGLASRLGLTQQGQITTLSLLHFNRSVSTLPRSQTEAFSDLKPRLFLHDLIWNKTWRKYWIEIIVKLDSKAKMMYGMDYLTPNIDQYIQRDCTIKICDKKNLLLRIPCKWLISLF
jgi:hypothetical protein